MGITLSGRAGTKQKEKVKNTKQKMVLNQALRDDTFLPETSWGARVLNSTGCLRIILSPAQSS